MIGSRHLVTHPPCVLVRPHTSSTTRGHHYRDTDRPHCESVSGYSRIIVNELMRKLIATLK